MNKKKIFFWLILVFSFLFFFLLFKYNLSLLKSETFDFNDNIFYADTFDTVENLRQITFTGDVRRHLLFSVTLSPAINLVEKLSHFSENESIIIILALAAAINIILAFLVLYLFTKKINISILFTILYAFLNSNLIYYSIPETYILSNTAVIIHIFFLLRFNKHPNRLNFLFLSIMTGIATLYNPTLFSLLLPNIFIFLKKKVNKNYPSYNIFISFMIFASTYILLRGRKFYEYFIAYNQKWASFSNFLSLENILNVLTSFLFFSVITPLDNLSQYIKWSDFIKYFDSILEIILILFYTFLLFKIVKYTIKNRRLIPDSFLLFIFSMIIFYIYFNPIESFLYSSQILFPIILIGSNCFKENKFRYKYVILSCFIFLIILKNLLALYSPF